jgi:DNA modification methylase
VTIYFGDNLKWLSDRKKFPDESVDLVYLDPPFNSNADYNILFREPSGQISQAQFHAFTDTWSWADAADTYHQFIDNCANVAVVELMEALQSFLKHSAMMAYLAMMAPRLIELHRVLKSTGSLYLHCDRRRAITYSDRNPRNTGGALAANICSTDGTADLSFLRRSRMENTQGESGSTNAHRRNAVLRS